MSKSANFAASMNHKEIKAQYLDQWILGWCYAYIPLDNFGCVGTYR